MKKIAFSLKHTLDAFEKRPIAVLGTVMLATSGLSQAADPLFSDQTDTANITFQDLSPSSGNMYAGVAWIDYDNDGDSDLFFPSFTRGDPNHFYHNNGDGTFTERATEAGIDNSIFPYTSAVAADYNGDGCDDLFLTAGGLDAGGSQLNSLYRNNFCTTGSTTFTNVSFISGLRDAADSAVAAFGDVDGDGDLDLYVGNYQAVPGSDVVCDANHFYLNNGDGTFTEMAAQLGIADLGCTLSVVMTDFDGDQDLDIYVANDFSPGGKISRVVADPDAIYRNLGPDANGLPQFEKALDINLTDAPNGMGIAVGDYDNDADFDYFTTTISSRPLPINDRLNRNDAGVFVDAAQEAGVIDASEFWGVSWGAAFLDVDNDGLLDLYKVSGSVPGSGAFGTENFIQQNRLYMNNDGSSFTEQTVAAGVQSSERQGRGLAVADYDGDGDLDMVVTNVGERQHDLTVIPGKPQLFRNDTVTDNHWLRINLRGNNPNHRAVGAKIILVSEGFSRFQTREIHAGSSHGSTHEYTAHFGIPSAETPQFLYIQWPTTGCGRFHFLDKKINTTLEYFEKDCVI